MNKKSATRRKDGRYMTYAVLSSGRHAVYGSSENKVIEKALQMELDDKEYCLVLRYAFSDVYRNWFMLKLKEVKGQTVDRIEVCYNKYFKNKPISRLDVRKLDNLFVMNWFLDLLNEYYITYKEFQRIMQLFCGVYDYAVDFLGLPDTLNWERIKKNIPHNKFKVTVKKEYAVSNDSIKIISNVVQNDLFSYSQPSAVALLFCNFYLGLRIGELAALKWSDIDFRNRIIYVRNSESKCHERDSNGNRTGCMLYNRDGDTKTGSSVRSVPMISEVFDILVLVRQYQNRMGYGTKYVVDDGLQYAATVRGLDKTLRRIIKELELPAFNSHLIRKTVASTLHDGGFSSREVADILGHKDIVTTERNYILSMQKDYDYVCQRMERVLVG